MCATSPEQQRSRHVEFGEATENFWGSLRFGDGTKLLALGGAKCDRFVVTALLKRWSEHSEP
jgi:hypothetical protein